MSQTSHITPRLFNFFRELKENNNREWFQQNKERYEADVREPLLRFIADFAIRLHSISAHFVASPRKVGGSLFRLHRDVRFSKDKSPYKTMAGIQFRHEKGKDAHAPGFYLHLEPGNVFAGIGLWCPDSKTLLKVRTAIADRGKEWQSILAENQFSKLFRQEGESLKRPPKGFDPNHPMIDELKRKSFVGFREFKEKETFDADFIDRYAETCRTGSDYMKFLTQSVGLEW